MGFIEDLRGKAELEKMADEEKREFHKQRKGLSMGVYKESGVEALLERLCAALRGLRRRTASCYYQVYEIDRAVDKTTLYRGNYYEERIERDVVEKDAMDEDSTFAKLQFDITHGSDVILKPTRASDGGLG